MIHLVRISTINSGIIINFARRISSYTKLLPEVSIFCFERAWYGRHIGKIVISHQSWFRENAMECNVDDFKHNAKCCSFGIFSCVNFFDCFVVWRQLAATSLQGCSLNMCINS